MAEVCAAVGLTSVGSFSATFKRLVGCAPSVYRRAWRASPEAASADVVPTCVVMAWTRPANRAIFEKSKARADG